MLLPAEYKDAATRICISAVQKFGLFQFAAHSKVSVIQCLTLPSCLPGSSKAVCSRTLAIIFQKNIFSEQRHNPPLHLEGLKVRMGSRMSIYEL